MAATTQTPLSLTRSMALAQYQASDTAPAVLAEFPGTAALIIGQALFAVYSWIQENVMKAALEECHYAQDVITQTLAAIYQPVPGTPLQHWIGSYNTQTQWWGDFFSPVVIATDGSLTVAGARLAYAYDPGKRQLSWDWQTIKTTRAKASAVLSDVANGKALAGSLNPRPQDGPVGFNGAFAAVEAAWPAASNGPANTARSVFSGPGRPTIAWQRTLAGANMRGGPVVDAAGNIYVGGEDKKLHCLGPDGTPKWAFQSDYPFYPTPTVGPDGTIYGMSDIVQAITLAGALKWKYERRDIAMVITVPAKITPDGSTLIVVAGSATGKPNRLIALNTATGAARWEMQFSRGSLSTPGIGPDGTIYVGSEECIVYAVNPTNGAVIWRHQEADGNWIRGPIAVGDDGNLYFCKSSQNPTTNDLVCLAANGTVTWRYRPSGEYLANPPSIAIGPDGTIFAGFLGMHAVSPSGKLKWRSSTAGNVGIYPGVAAVDQNGAVYFGTSDNKLFCWSAAGQMSWRLDVGAASAGPAITANGTLLFSDGHQTITAVRQI